MKSRMQNILRLSLFIVVLLLISISGCSDDPSSPAEEEETPKTGATIGINGGTVGTDDISIIIPAGAFTEDQHISISEIQDDSTFGKHKVTSLLQIEGLTNEFKKPIKIKMKYSGELYGENFLAIGDYFYDPKTRDTSVTYGLFPAIDSSAFLISEIPVQSELILEKPQNWRKKYFRYIGAISGFNTAYSKHYVIRYPQSMDKSNLQEYKNALDSVYSLVHDDMEFPSSTRHYGGYYDQEIVLLYRNQIGKYFLNWYGKVYINMSVRNVVHHNFSWAKERLFEYETGLYSFDSYSWLDRAVLSWSEELLADNKNSFTTPILFENFYYAPFLGLEAGVIAGYYDYYWHGIGMAPVIKYLVQSEGFGLSGIGRMYQNKSERDLSMPPQILLLALYSHSTYWWPDFFIEYILGNIYPVPIDYFLDYAEAWTVNDITDTLAVFNSDDGLFGCRDLSANMYQIYLNHNNFEETDNMLFSLENTGGSEYLSIVMFGINGDKVEYLNTADAQDFEIPNLKRYYDNGTKQFLAVVVNSKYNTSNYLGQSSYELKVSIKKPKEYTRCSIEYRLLQKTQSEKTGNVGFDETWETSGVSQRDEAIFDGSLTEDTFTGSYTDNTNSSTSTQTNNYSVTVKFNSEKTKIESFSLTNIETKEIWHTTDDWKSKFDVVKRISGSDIDKVNNIEGITFRVVGESTCNNVLSANHTVSHQTTWTSSGSQKWENVESRSIEYSCDENSYLNIIFLNE